MEITDNMCCVAADIPTPCLVIDENRLEQNIRRIHDYAARHGFSIRPHVKTHKSLYITRMQMAAGAKGIGKAVAAHVAERATAEVEPTAPDEWQIGLVVGPLGGVV